MHSKSIALLALSATAAVASPFHKRQELRHHHHHGTGSFSLRPTGTGTGFPAGNDTNAFGPTGTALLSSQIMTVSPLPASPSLDSQTGINQAVDASSSSSCTTTSIVTETSINLVTVTGTQAVTAVTQVAASKAAVSSVSAGAFYGGGHSWSYGGNGQSSVPANTAPVPAGPGAPSAPAVSSVTAVSSVPPISSFPIVSSAPAFGSSAATTLVSMPSASKSSAAASSAVASSLPSTGSSGGKRGISFNDASLVSAFGKSVSWAYNWAATESGNLGGAEFVPMMWGTNSVSGFASSVGSATHVLSFNEPDLSTQSNIDPATAAKLHIQGMQSLKGKVQIGSPAVTNGGGDSPPMGTTWLDQFFTACGTDCPVDFVAYHWYAGADSIAYFQSHTQDIINTAAKYGVNKVWLTEFQPTSGDANAQAAFMKAAVEFLDATPAVERYAAFMASDGTMLSGGSLNTLGSAYAGAS